MLTRSRSAAAVAALLVFPALSACQSVEDLLDATPVPEPPGVSGEFSELVPFTVEVDAAALTSAIEALAVEEEADEGYDRSLFPHWSDGDGNGCNSDHI